MSRAHVAIGLRTVGSVAAVVLVYRELPGFFAAWETDATLQWWAARSTGFFAYVAFAISMFTGLMISSRGLDGGITRKTVLEHHEQWTLAAVIATVAHVLVIVTDDYSSIDVVGALVPGASSELTAPTGAGTVALWVLAILVLSSWLRGYMSFLAWRVTHTVALGAFGLALVHGVTAGTDASAWPVQLLYLGTGSAVAAGTVFRFLYVARRKGAGSGAAA
jgi:predicted ferric reductase